MSKIISLPQAQLKNAKKVQDDNQARLLAFSELVEKCRVNSELTENVNFNLLDKHSHRMSIFDSDTSVHSKNLFNEDKKYSENVYLGAAVLDDGTFLEPIVVVPKTVDAKDLGQFSYLGHVIDVFAGGRVREFRKSRQVLNPSICIATCDEGPQRSEKFIQSLSICVSKIDGRRLLVPLQAWFAKWGDILPGDLDTSKFDPYADSTYTNELRTGDLVSGTQSVYVIIATLA